MNKFFVKKVISNIWFTAALMLIVWRVLLVVSTLFADKLIPFSPSYPYYESMLANRGPWWLVRWAGFDGVHYITIATKGYIGTGLIQAFFPLYPAMTQLFNLFHNVVYSGLLVSHIFTYLMLVFAGKLLGTERKKSSFFALCLSLLIFPTSFFFGAMYTESLFLFLVFSSFYAIRLRRWDVAILCSFFATATRITGVFLVLALLVEMYQEFRSTKKTHTSRFFRLIGVVCIGLGGLFLYMAFLAWKFHDPLYFLHVQAEFGGGRQESFVPLLQVLYRYMRIFLSFFILGENGWPIWSWSYYAYLQELVFTSSVGIVLAIATVKKGMVRLSYLIYSWGAYILPTLTGTLQSMPRYIMIIFPLFFLMERMYHNNRRFFYFLCVVQLIFLIINTMLFVQGLWVA
ncbi:MAG: hypothetical protein HZA34_01380 [Candidatus Pacebacteria bacterium]|nr:hypothetical protein [Candidatus Paceibacterota bacterium]